MPTSGAITLPKQQVRELIGSFDALCEVGVGIAERLEFYRQQQVHGTAAGRWTHRQTGKLATTTVVQLGRA
jgi:hypothetical protein